MMLMCVVSFVWGVVLLEFSRLFPHEIMSTLFLGAGGGEFGDSFSASRPLLLEAVFVFSIAFRRWHFLFSGLFSAFFIFILVPECCPAFFSWKFLLFVEGAIYVQVEGRYFFLRRAVYSIRILSSSWWFFGDMSLLTEVVFVCKELFFQGGKLLFMGCKIWSSM